MGRTRGRLAVLSGAALALPGALLVLAFLTVMAGPASADDPPFECTNSDGGSSSLCERTRDLGPLGWAVVIGLVLVVILGIGWFFRLRQRRRDRVERSRHGWRRWLRRRRRADRY
jgi:hypothetical protein